MIENNPNPENNHSALQDFMRNVLQVQNHPQLCVIDDNAKTPPPSPTRTTRQQQKKPILQFTTAVNLQEMKMRWPTSPSTASKSKVGMDRWGDLHYEPEQRQLREEQQQQQITRRKGATNNASNKTEASNHRFHDLQFNDRPLPSSVIGNGHVAMLRQDSLERHFLAVEEDTDAKEEAGEEETAVSLPTVPEDESLNAPHVAMTSPKRKRQRHLFKKTGKKESESAKKNAKDKDTRKDKTGKSSKPWKSDMEKEKREKNCKEDAKKKQSKPSTE